jgi:D-tagatose-1,6-bisphosphate aldolase subunit GatZ/KbaZ
MNPLDQIVRAQKNGHAVGIASICTAHPLALEATLRHGLEHDMTVLIEATCNQVNQFGGYTGLRPADFVRLVTGLADSIKFPRERLLLGGDHLGPLPWSAEPAAVAMEKARVMVSEYARAGFGKIHLDCSTPCADDTELSVEEMARRAAELAVVAENRCRSEGLPLPRYVIGTEVPAAGGTKAGEDELAVTRPADAAETIDLSRLAFRNAGIEAAWERVIALVVQPGVEFGHATVHAYDRVAARPLTEFIASVPGLVFEAHSTDYQSRSALRALVEDEFAILKVGPGLTFALREAIFALAEMEDQLCESPSGLRATLEHLMLAHPAYWQKHYAGSPVEQRLARAFSFSDRIRYYWAYPEAQAGVQSLLANLDQEAIPLTLVSQYFPTEYEQIRAGNLPLNSKTLLFGRMLKVLDDYRLACSGR